MHAMRWEERQDQESAHLIMNHVSSSDPVAPLPCPVCRMGIIMCPLKGCHRDPMR